MEAALNIGLMEGVIVVFAMLLLFVLAFGFLNKTKPLGDGKEGLYSLIAIAITLILIVNRPILNMILFMTPWFAVVLFIAFFVLFLVAVLGGEEAANFSNMKGAIVTIALIIFLFAFIGYLNDPEVLEEDEEESVRSSEFWESLSVILHPQVLGLIVMLLIAGFAVLLITKK